ncbi:hypothetical protein O181_017031 [Austropuccinia psidii MF-1]|uniref:DNA helicase n=1 Tax=Austropuccinia psidii MF-1 TaxID=1389203 RepID=A0A9Q3C2S2_9BASI|nr:hypothetical protein [Austropuccinia psidii MF-1]
MIASSDPKFQIFLLTIGDGSSSNHQTIKIPSNIVVSRNSEGEEFEEKTNHTFPEVTWNYERSDYFSEREILTPRDISVNLSNDKVLNRLTGQTFTYLSFYSAEDAPQNLHQPFNSLTISGLPPHCLQIEKGWPIVLSHKSDK